MKVIPKRKAQLLSVWRFGTVGAGAVAFALVWVAIVVIALFQETLSFKNPAFLFGDPLLCVSVVFGAVGLKSLPTHVYYWFDDRGFQRRLLLIGYVLGIGTEAFFRWRIEGLSTYQFSDWYHLAVFGLLFYWVTLGLIASAYAAFKTKTNQWAFWPAMVLVIIWFGLGLVNAQNFGQSYPEIGWQDIWPF